MKRSTIGGHKKALRIAGNPEWVLRVDGNFVGVILFGISACQSSQQAEKLRVLYRVTPTKWTSTLKSTMDFQQSVTPSYAFLRPSTVLLFVAQSCSSVCPSIHPANPLNPINFIDQFIKLVITSLVWDCNLICFLASLKCIQCNKFFAGKVSLGKSK